MDYDYDFWTIRAMISEGGSFVKALAMAAMHADRNNLTKLKISFHEYFDDYEERGQKLRFEACPEGICDGSGEVACDEEDGEGHTMRGVGTEKCDCRKK